MAIVPDLAGSSPGVTGVNGTQGVDRILSKPNRNVAGSPYGSVTPAYSGEQVLDYTTGQIWMASGGLANTNWIPVTKVV